VIPAEIVPLDAQHFDALRRFLEGLPERDLTFIEEDVRDPAVAERWVRERKPEHPARHWVAVDQAGVLALMTLVPLAGWSSHVGRMRVIVDPAARGQGLGSALARHGLRSAVDTGLSKVIVDVVADDEYALRLFEALGFRGQAVLIDHIRDRDGQLRDLLVLAHDASEEWSAMASLGLAEDLGPG
jgi:ribosomal protein S18 acetylase RimI-like enzyme